MTTPSGFACHPSTGGEFGWGMKFFLWRGADRASAVRRCLILRVRPGSRRSTLLTIVTSFQTVTMPICFVYRRSTLLPQRFDLDGACKGGATVPVAICQVGVRKRDVCATFGQLPASGVVSSVDIGWLGCAGISRYSVGEMRTIIHVDMDAFFASVEVLDNPALRGVPLVVGGAVARGVVSAASYEARKFGVHSAMPMATAMRLCPQLVVVHGHMSRYRDVSEQIMRILAEYSPLMEPMSVDEAYLDVTNWLPQGMTAVQVAIEIQQRIAEESGGLSCSIGVASGKAIAKMASDLRKPNGLVEVPPGTEADFLAPLPIGQLRGVGEATERKLRSLGINTIGDLTRIPEEVLQTRFGAHGRDLLALAQGHDDSPVVPERQAKSIGRETTFLQDVADYHQLEATLLELAEDVAHSLRRAELLARGLTLKIRYPDFTTFTRAQQLATPLQHSGQLYVHARQLLSACHIRRPLRLIGITATSLLPQGEGQLSLFDDPAGNKQARIDHALDAVRARFGKAAIKRARFTEREP